MRFALHVLSVILLWVPAKAVIAVAWMTPLGLFAMLVYICGGTRGVLGCLARAALAPDEHLDRLFRID